MDDDLDVQKNIDKLVSFFSNATYEEIMKVLDKVIKDDSTREEVRL